MLNWWLGKSGEDTRRDNDDVDAPETPAPLFAARAIKSAIFGTPAPPPGDTTMAERFAELNAMPSRTDESPSKPPGILMTPGTARTRKTVSFGQQVKDAELKPTTKSGIPEDCPGKFPSPWVPKVPSKLGDGESRRTALTRSLEKVRDTRRKVTEERDAKSRLSSVPDTPTQIKVKTKMTTYQVVDDGNESGLLQLERPSSRRRGSNDRKDSEKELERPPSRGKDTVDEGKAPEKQQLERPPSRRKESAEQDATIDVSQPQSRSGKYWKSEYERYHEEAKAAMKQLIRYKQLAKCYARLKEDEAIDLAAKLLEEQQRVDMMEDKIAELVTQAADSRLNGDGDSPALMRDLARQTALAVQYRSQVDKFRIALENRDLEQRERRGSNADERELTSGDSRDNIRAMAALRTDMQSMRINLSAAEKKAIELEHENAKLSRELARTKEDLVQSEKRREAADERNNDTLRLLEELQKNYDSLKEAAKSQRRDAEQLLRRRAEQVAGLKKEIKTLKHRPSSDNIATEHSSSRHAEDPELAEKRRRRRSTVVVDEVKDIVVESPRRTSRSAHSTERRRSTYKENEREQRHAERSARSASPEKPTVKRTSRASLNDYLDDAAKERAKNTALAEIANTKADPPNKSRRYTTEASLRDRFSTLRNSPAKEDFVVSPLKPDDEMGESTQQVHVSMPASQRAQPSPRPSRYNFTQDDTPTPGTIKYSFNDGVRDKTERSRLGSMASTRSRTDLDPERAAAAKVRLEQRNAERRRANRQENVRP